MPDGSSATATVDEAATRDATSDAVVSASDGCVPVTAAVDATRPAAADVIVDVADVDDNVVVAALVAADGCAASGVVGCMVSRSAIGCCKLSAPLTVAAAAGCCASSRSNR